MGVIFGLSSLTGSDVPGRFTGLGHFGLYAMLGALYLAALSPQRPSWKHAIAAVLLASAYGVTDEFHQSFVPGRMPDVMDWLVDTAGAASAAGVMALLSRAGDRPGRRAW
jgi:VanZ family protein